VGIPGIPRGSLGRWAWEFAASAGPRAEFGDAAWLAGWLLRRALDSARAREVPAAHGRPAAWAGDVPADRAVAAHLGPEAAVWPVSVAAWPAWDQVNVQTGLDAWLAGPGRRHQLVGGAPSGSDLGGVSTAARPAGPGRLARRCVTRGIYLVADDGGGRLALLLQGPADGGPAEPVTLQVIAPDRDTGEQVLDRVRALSAEHSVYRGRVISFGGDGPGASGGQPAFLDRPAVARSQVVLPGDLLDGIERQVLGIARHSQTLLANGQHLKRGVLLHGPPGTGKSHTVRYLLSQLPGVTAILLTGAALAFIGEACEMARALQPAVVVVEDVDLIAAQRRPGSPPHPLLIQLLGEMDGTGADADVAFLLTTSRADLLEEALAGRPGRVDHTARLPLPDAAARRRLLRVYQGNLQFSRPTAAAVVARTDGVTASFMKELLRRAALHAAARPVRGGRTPDGRAPDSRTPDGKAPDGKAPDGRAPEAPLRVTARHFSRALDELLDSSSQLPGAGFGGRAARGADVVIRPVLTHLTPTR
jgi:hypothetical protein